MRELPEEYDLLVDPHVGDFPGDGDEDEVRVPLELRVNHEPATRHKEKVAVDEDPNKSPGALGHFRELPLAHGARKRNIADYINLIGSVSAGHRSHP